MKIGNRIIFDQDGEIIYQMGEMQGHVLPRKEITSLHHLDFEHGEIDYDNQELVGVDMVTMTPIFKQIKRARGNNRRIRKPAITK